MISGENSGFEILGKTLLEINTIFDKNPKLRGAKTEKEFNQIVKKGLKK